MKKIYSLMLALFATLCVGTAYAQDPITFKLNVADSKAISVQTQAGWSWTDIPIVDGENQITATYNEDWEAYDAIQVVAKSGYLVDSITSSTETAPQWEDQRNWGSSYGFALEPSENCSGAVYTVYTTNLNLLRQDSVVVIIDNPSKVKVMYYGSGQIDITNDTSVVYYCSDPEEKRLQDLPLTVRANYGSLIYKVFLNSDEVKKVVEYGEEYYLFNTLAEGDTIRVLTEAPADLTAPAILKLDEIAKEALDSVLVNGVKVELKDTILVPWGKSIALAFNVEDYKVTANNTTLSNYSNPYSAVVTDTTIIEVTAVKYVKYDVTLILHDYTCFEQLYVDNYIYPEKDTTILSMNSKSPRIALYAANDCLIDSIKWNNELKTGTTIECSEEGVLEVWAHKIVRNEKFMLYVERDSMSSMSMMSKTYHYFAGYYAPLSADYTECAFSVADDNPISASFYNKSHNRAICYLNDEILTYSYDGYEIADGDVFKVFADTAEVFEVNMYVEDGVAVTDITKDRIVPIVDWTNPVSVLQNTEISFTTDATVKVNDDVVAGEAGVYTLVIKANTVILVGDVEQPTGMENAVISNKAEKFVRDGQLIIRMNGVEYNVLGAKLQ